MIAFLRNLFSPPLPIGGISGATLSAYRRIGLPSSDNPGLEGIGVIRRNGEPAGLSLDGRELAALGQGYWGIVYEHPRFPGAVIKLPVVSAAGRLFDPPASWPEVLRKEAATTEKLAELGAGPRLLGRAEIEGVQVMIRERVFGETVSSYIRARQFTNVELALFESLVDRLVAGAISVIDMRPDNLILGHTLFGSGVAAFVIDGMGYMTLSAFGPEKEVRRRIFNQDFVLELQYVDGSGWVDRVCQLGPYLEDAALRTITPSFLDWFLK